jgi:hypothetical protein
MKGRFWYYLQELFTFSKAEKRSIMLLLIMIFIVILSTYLFPLVLSNKKAVNIEEARKQIEEFEKKIAPDTVVRIQKRVYKRKEKIALVLHDVLRLPREMAVDVCGETDSAFRQRLLQARRQVLFAKDQNG